MALETYELDKKMLEYSISQFRNIPEYVKICEAFCVGLGSIQNSVDYLSDMIDKDKAQGVWLDYIGWLVGNIREEYIDTSKFFCVNETHTVNGEPAGDINVSKFFYFPRLSSEGGVSTNLSDELFKEQIDAKIFYNISNGTREDNIRIIKKLVNADKVIIQNYADKPLELQPMELEISVYGDNILSQNIKSRIESVLANGVSIHGDVNIYENLSYETIESMVNEIVEMNNISEVDPDYTYVYIDDDLDEILEID